MRSDTPPIPLATIALAAIVAACAGSRPARPAAPRAGGYDVHSEGRIPPPPPVPEAADEVVETPLSPESLQVESAPPPPPEPAAQPDTAGTVPGFRVQVFASSSRVVAERAAQAARRRLGVAAYVVPWAGLYRVQVGDFRSREAARGLLERARSGFYPDAWIVTTRVRAVGAPRG